MNEDVIEWLLRSDEPRTRYRTRLDLLEQSSDYPEVRLAHQEMINHEKVLGLIGEIIHWPGTALKRHNDASHLIQKISMVAEFGLRENNPGIKTVFLCPRDDSNI